MIHHDNTMILIYLHAHHMKQQEKSNDFLSSLSVQSKFKDILYIFTAFFLSRRPSSCVKNHQIMKYDTIPPVGVHDDDLTRQNVEKKDNEK